MTSANKSTGQMPAYTPEELEAAIRAAGAQVEAHQNAGHSQKAREAFDEVRRLVAMRTAETVEAMERERGLYRA